MNVSFNGFQEQIVTFETDAALEAGVPVKVAANGRVAKCGDGDIPAGVTAAPSREGLAAVQVNGYVRIGYSGTVPELNRTTVAADATGGIKTSEKGREVLVVEQDTAAKQVGMIL